MHMQMPHGSPKPQPVTGMGMDPAVALGYRLMCVCMCKCVKCINVFKSHIYLSNTCDPLSNTYPSATSFMPIEGAWNKWRKIHFSTKFAIFSLEFCSSELWLSDRSTCGVPRERFHSVTVHILICEDGLWTICTAWSMWSKPGKQQNIMQGS